jgi:hypothetical protein
MYLRPLLFWSAGKILRSIGLPDFALLFSSNVCNLSSRRKKKQHISGLLDHFQWVGNAARPKAVPYVIDLTADFAG